MVRESHGNLHEEPDIHGLLLHRADDKEDQESQWADHVPYLQACAGKY